MQKMNLYTVIVDIIIHINFDFNVIKLRFLYLVYYIHRYPVTLDYQRRYISLQGMCENVNMQVFLEII